MKTPAEVYELLPRKLPTDPLPPNYGDGFKHSSVRRDGAIMWGGDQVFVGEAFATKVIGLSAVASRSPASGERDD